MNDKRLNYILPNNHIKITSNYLLGFIEGDGSFYYNKSDDSVRISLTVIEKDRIVLDKIKEFLLNKLDNNSLFLAINTKLMRINNKNLGEKRKLISVLEISQIDYICNILIPFFDDLNFRSKKYLDYLDFKKIAFLILEGKHLLKEGKDIIVKLANTMNNNRLSTNLNKFLFQDSQFEKKLELLIKSDPLIQIDTEGRAIIIKDNKCIRTTYIIEAKYPNGNIIYYPTGHTCAIALNVSDTTISKKLNDKKPIINKDNKVLVSSLKRIKVYTKN